MVYYQAVVEQDLTSWLILLEDKLLLIADSPLGEEADLHQRLEKWIFVGHSHIYQRIYIYI